MEDPLPLEEPRHSVGWYSQATADGMLRPGARLLIRCDEGPCLSRLETFPPRLEIPDQGGLYVLVDDGPVEAWKYQFVPTIDHDTRSGRLG